MSSANASIRSATVPRPRVYIDADVLLAASVSTHGASHILIKLAELTLIEGVISEAVQVGVERNLRAKLLAALPAYRALVESTKLRLVPWPTKETTGSLSRADRRGGSAPFGRGLSCGLPIPGHSQYQGLRSEAWPDRGSKAWCVPRENPSAARPAHPVRRRMRSA
jgi:hypothetical protein